MVKLEVTGTPAVGNGVSASFQGLRASTAALQVRSCFGHCDSSSVCRPHHYSQSLISCDALNAQSVWCTYSPCCCHLAASIGSATSSSSSVRRKALAH